MTTTIDPAPQPKCLYCTRSAIPGMTRCRDCRASHKRSAAKLRRKWAALGRCVMCGGEVPPGGTSRCVPCKAANARLGRAFRERLRTLGLCITCGKAPPHPGTSATGQKCSRCLACIEKLRAGKRRIHD